MSLAPIHSSLEGGGINEDNKCIIKPNLSTNNWDYFDIHILKWRWENVARNIPISTPLFTPMSLLRQFNITNLLPLPEG